MSRSAARDRAEALGVVCEGVPPRVLKVQIHPERRHICLLICLLSKSDLHRAVSQGGAFQLV